MPNFCANASAVEASREPTATAVPLRHVITPAAEWLLDNYYLIEEQIRTAQRHLPKGYSRELPRLLSGPSARLPRVGDVDFTVDRLLLRAEHDGDQCAGGRDCGGISGAEVLVGRTICLDEIIRLT